MISISRAFEGVNRALRELEERIDVLEESTEEARDDETPDDDFGG